MKFKIDENLPQEIAGILAGNNYDATTVKQQNMEGVDDATLISVCKKEQRILVTLDTDFSDIRTYPPEDCCGIIVMRIRNHSRQNIIRIFQKVVPGFNLEKLDQSLWIVEEDVIRIRTKQ